MAEFKTILTKYGRDALADAITTQQPLKLTEVAAGDGGGSYYELSEDQTALRNEIWRGNTNDLFSLDNATGDVVAEAVIPPEAAPEGGWNVREVGVYDAAGGLFAVGLYPLDYQPDLLSGSAKQIYIRVIMEVGNTAAIEVIVDHSIVLASKADITELQGDFRGLEQEFNELNVYVNNGFRFLTPEMFKATTANDEEMIKKCASEAKAQNLPVFASGTYTLTNIIQFDGIRWRGGTFVGTGKYTCIQLIGADVEGATFNLVYVHITKSGNTRFHKNKLFNQTFTCALLIKSFDTNGNIDCCFNEFWACNYAILQQGTGDGSVLSGRYSFNHIHDIHGDGIELNVVNAHYASGLVIEGNLISNVDGTGAAWGIGIGIAGKGPYSIDEADDQYVAGFVIRNNHIVGCRQCIHVELGRDFVIENNYCWPDTSKSTSSGLYFAAVAIYGCKRFTIDGVTGEPVGTANRFILIEWGVNSSKYAGPPRDFTLRNINTHNGDIEVATGGANNWTNDTVLENIRARTLKWRGLPPNSVFRNVSVQKIDCIGVHDSTEGSGGGIYSRPFFTYTNWSNVVCLNPTDSLTYASFSKLYVDRIDQNGNNFMVPTTMQVPGNRGPKLFSQTEHYMLPDDEIAGGREFSQGTVLMKPSGGYYLITKGGAFINQNGDYADKIRQTTGGQSYIEALNKDWSKGQGAKEAGTRLVIPGAGPGATDLTTTIVRGGHIINSVYRCDIDPPIASSTEQGVVIRALYPMEFKEVIYPPPEVPKSG